MPKGGRRPTGLHEGRDGWLFWLGADGQFPELWRDGLAARWRLRRWRLRLRRRARDAERRGARFVQLFAPDKLTLYGDMAGLPRLDPGQSFARRIARRSLHVVDLVAPLEALRAQGVQVAHRTDSHWTEAGYVAAFRALCAALDVRPGAAVLEGSPPGEPVAWLGDLGGKLDPERREMRRFRTFAKHARRVEANAVVRRGEAVNDPFGPGHHLWARQVLANDDARVDPRRVVLFGDSYSFDAHGLGPMLAETFAEVHMLWSPRVDWDYVAQVRPQFVICETAERWVRLSKPDGVHVDAEADARTAAPDRPTGRP